MQLIDAAVSSDEDVASRVHHQADRVGDVGPDQRRLGLADGCAPSHHAVIALIRHVQQAAVGRDSDTGREVQSW
jgi:hypothetical protein